MKRRMFLIVILVLFLMPLVILPDRMYTNSPVTNVYEDTGNILSADGDESSESITSFSETLSDDTALDPDSDTNGDFSVSEWGSGETLSDDTALDPDSDTNGDFSVSEWGSGETLADDQMLYPDAEYLFHDDCTSTTNWAFKGGEDSNPANRSIEVVADGEDSNAIKIGGHFYGDPTPEEYQAYGLNITASAGDQAVPVGGTTIISVRWKTDTATEGGRLMVKYGDYSNQYIVDPAEPSSSWQTSQLTLTAAKINVTDLWVWTWEITPNIDDGWYYVLIDWVTITVTEMMMDSDGNSLISDDVYIDSFADESDWTYSSSSGLSGGEYGITTDGDVLDIWFTLDDVGNEWVMYVTVLDTPVSIDTWLEFRYRGETTGCLIYVQIEDSDADWIWALAGGISTTWYTYRYYLGDSGLDDVKKIRLRLDDTPNSLDTGTLSLFVDYLRIANDTGWQHDGSTTAGVQNIGDATSSSDGDLLSIIRGAGGSAAYIWVDTTVTAANLEPDYYPFLEIAFSSACIGNETAIFVYDGAATTRILGDQTITQTIYRFNIESVLGSNQLQKVLVYANTIGGRVEIDYIKAYSLLNWTYYTTETNNKETAVAYYDSAESSLVLEKEFDTANDYFAIKTENISINYEVNDMVMLVTVKASANSSSRIRVQMNRHGGSNNRLYYLYDDWQTIAMPLDSVSDHGHELYLYLWDWSAASPASGTFQIYIKDNITIRPSWYDATTESGTYGESFADVSDWEQIVCEADDSFSTDGDVLGWVMDNNGNPDSDYLQSNSPSLIAGSYYAEIRYKYNTTATVKNLMYWKPYDDRVGTGGLLFDLTRTVDEWVTLKEYFYSVDGIENVYFYHGFSTHDDGLFSVDYFRIAPADEMGASNDMSSYSNSDEATMRSESNGDTLRLYATAASYGRCYFFKESSIDPDYYPFVELSIPVSEAQWYLSIVWSDTSQDVLHNYADEAGIFRFNIEVLSGGNVDVDYLYFAVLYNDQYYVDLDYIKFYSLLNWTYYDTGTNLEESSVAYYDDSESAIVLEKEFDTSNDYLGIKTENISIGYETTDMVALVTAKASANTSCSLRFLYEAGSYDTDEIYFLYDDWQTFAIPLSTSSHTVSYFYLMLQNWISASPASGTYQIYIKDNITIRPSWYDATTESGTYGESFASVSDFVFNETVANSYSKSTDGDIGNFTTVDGGMTRWNYDFSLSSGSYYIELRLKDLDNPAGSVVFRIEWYDGATWTWIDLSAFVNYGGAWDDPASSFSTGKQQVSFSSDVTSIGIRVSYRSDLQSSLGIDYLRIAPADEMGIQFDGSIISVEPHRSTTVYEGDGDIVHITDTNAGSGAGFLHTGVSIKLSYYPFIEIRWKSAGGSSIRMELGDENSVFTYEILYASTSWFTTRFNVLAEVAGDYITHFAIYDEADNVQELWIDYVKFYSIANFSSFGFDTVNDYFYVDNGVLVSERATGNVISAYYENSLLSVNTATYNIWNTTIDDATDFTFGVYVAGWLDYTRGDSRGALTSGTLTRFRFVSYGNFRLSEIKFIEDSAAPEIVSEFVTPSTPDDAGEVTFTAVTFDTIEVYKVTLNAVVYPNGFSDVDYDMTEETPDELWYYTFSTMLEGYYLFQITATDGANTDVAYLPVSVKEAGISLTPISFIGAGPDFTGVQFSFDCNRAGTFSITEWTEVNATYATDEAETHTGTIIDGFNNIFWTKLTTPALTVYFNFTINSGSLQANWTSTYQVAQLVFDVVLSDKFTDFDMVFIEGESTKAATYQIYDANNILRDSGTIPQGTFALNFDMWNKKSLADHSYGIKFTNGTSVDWINGSYYADNPEQYQGGGVVTVAPWWQDPMTWVIIGGGIALVYVITSGRKEGNLPNAPKGMK